MHRSIRIIKELTNADALNDMFISDNQPVKIKYWSISSGSFFIVYHYGASPYAAVLYRLHYIFIHLYFSHIKLQRLILHDCKS